MNSSAEVTPAAGDAFCRFPATMGQGRVPLGRTTRAGSLALTVALACCAAGIHSAHADDAVPDISGYWMIPYGPVPPRREPTAFEQSALDRLPAGTVLLADSGLAEMPPGVYGGLSVRAQALQRARAYDPEVQRSVTTTCRPPSVIHAMQGPFPMEIFQGADMLVIKMEYFDLVRIIFMNEQDHPEDWPHSPVGHSIGRWEEETLVVQTKYLSSATIFNNGLDHSDDVRLTERFRLSEDGGTLLVTQEFEDPQTFAGRAARLLPLERGDGRVYPYACDPTYGVAIEAREEDSP